jgi:hypothetical protein
MSDTTLETFLVSGLLVLIAAIGYLAWSAWRWVDRERDMEKLALSGVSHELRLNLKRMLTELAGLANGSVRSEIDIVPVIHPQLDALLSRPNEADRRGLTIIRGNYNELSAHKQSLRLAISQRGDVDAGRKGWRRCGHRGDFNTLPLGRAKRSAARSGPVNPKLACSRLDETERLSCRSSARHASTRSGGCASAR